MSRVILREGFGQNEFAKNRLNTRMRGCFEVIERTDEHVQQMVEKIKKKLNMATSAAIKSNHYKKEHYEDIKEIYDMIMDRSTFSISEMEAIVSELGRIKK